MKERSKTSREDAEKLEAAVEELVEHLHDDQPKGAPSELGGEVPSTRHHRTEAEFRRLAEIGKAMVDAHVSGKPRR